MPTDPETPRTPLRDAAFALVPVFNALLEQAGDDQELLDSLFVPTLTQKAERLGVEPRVLMAELNKVLFGPDNVLNAPDE